MHEAGFLSYFSSRIHYYTWGNGPRIVFAFHGYGESGKSFDFFGPAMATRLTLVAIDLPFHGLTEWNEASELDPPQLLAIMEMIVTRLPAPPAAGLLSTQWSLLGYSMGGRIAMGLLQDEPERFDRLVLAAPDGMVINPWYRIATATAAGNRLFRWSMRRPALLFLVLRFCQALGALNPSVYKFAMHYIDDDEARRDLYIRWTAMRRFKPDLSRIGAVIRRHQLPVTLIYGKYDRIIRWQHAEKFQKRVAETCRLMLVEAGHQLMRPPFLPVFLPLLL